MLMIRLQRVGRKHEPTFRLVLTDSKNSTKSGKYLEVLGSYDPRLENKIEQFDVAKIKHWISKGAQLSGTVHNFLVHKKAIEGKKMNVLPKKRPIKKAEEKVEAKGEAKKEAPATTAAPAEAEKAPAVEAKADAPAPSPAPVAA
jgi:small subunit ribosomal protein S16